MLRGPSTTVPVSVMVPGYAPDCTSAVAENEIVLSDASSQLKPVIVWGGSAEMNVGETGIVLADASSQLSPVIVGGGSGEMNVGETGAGREPAGAAGTPPLPTPAARSADDRHNEIARRPPVA